jgi:hypothetical protein
MTDGFDVAIYTIRAKTLTCGLDYGCLPAQSIAATVVLFETCAPGGSSPGY